MCEPSEARTYTDSQIDPSVACIVEASAEEVVAFSVAVRTPAPPTLGSLVSCMQGQSQNLVRFRRFNGNSEVDFVQFNSARWIWPVAAFETSFTMV